MKQIKTNGKDWLFVEINNDADLETINEHIFINFLNGKLSHANWLLFTTTDNISELQADEIVSKVVKQDGSFVGYQDHEERYPCPMYSDAISSFSTFKLHHNLTGRYAILRKL
jgi:hypothetical protein